MDIISKPRQLMIAAINKNLSDFYDFNNKIVITAGAGGGQFLEYGFRAKGVFAVDNDRDAIDKLKKKLLEKGLDKKFTIVCSDFLETSMTGDIVFFEFCLHEMADPRVALEHGFKMAPAILIADHLPGNEWTYITDEDEKVRKSREAYESFKIKVFRRYEDHQFFTDYNELYQKVKGQGFNSVNRIRNYKGRENFSIPMLYGFSIIKR